MNQIQEVYGKKVNQGKVFYYVRFKGKPESENSWVPAESLGNLNEIPGKFEIKSNEESVIRTRKGSFSAGDEVEKVVQIVWNEEKNESMGEIQWKSNTLYNSLYPLNYLHELCPKEMCEVYYSLLKFTYTP